jgi:hypothetical protein
MFKKELDKVKYKEIYEYIDKLYNEMNLNKKVRVNIINSKYMAGLAHGTRSIDLTKPLIDIYNKSPYVVKLVIAHELVHIKYKDDSLKRAWWTFILTKKARVNILMQESRADIEGAYFSKLSHDEISKTHMIQKQYNEQTSVSHKEFKYGYASRERRSQYCNKFNCLNITAIDEIIEDFCRALRIGNIEKYKRIGKRYATVKI